MDWPNVLNNCKFPKMQKQFSTLYALRLCYHSLKLIHLNQYTYHFANFIQGRFHWWQWQTDEGREAVQLHVGLKQHSKIVSFQRYESFNLCTNICTSKQGPFEWKSALTLKQLYPLWKVKVVPGTHQAPCHEELRQWRSAVDGGGQLHVPSAFPLGSSPQYPLDRKVCRP
jgi:hypothetical protein